jgi:hypothetical protein
MYSFKSLSGNTHYIKTEIAALFDRVQAEYIIKKVYKFNSNRTTTIMQENITIEGTLQDHLDFYFNEREQSHEVVGYITINNEYKIFLSGHANSPSFFRCSITLVGNDRLKQPTYEHFEEIVKIECSANIKSARKI